MAGDFHERLAAEGRPSRSECAACGLAIAPLLILLGFALRGLVSCFAILAFTAVAVVALSFLKPSLPHPAPIAWLPGGCAILEFMALGAPTVTTERIGRRETVMEGCNGFLAPIRHNQCMTARLRDLVLDKALRCRMGAESCRMATDVFGEGVVAHRIFSDLYELADEAQTG